MAIPLGQRILTDALKIVRDPKRWTTGVDAKDAKGKPCLPSSSKAVRFCARGALMRAAYEISPQSGDIPSSFTLNALNPDHLVTINDGPNGRRKIVAIFEKALEDLQA